LGYRLDSVIEIYFLRLFWWHGSRLMRLEPDKHERTIVVEVRVCGFFNEELVESSAK
jgi:hypothetical protein